MYATTTQKLNPPQNPSHDFLGEILSKRRRLPNSEPTQNAPVSFIQMKINIDNTNSQPPSKYSATDVANGTDTYICAIIDFPNSSTGLSFFKNSSTTNLNTKYAVKPIRLYLFKQLLKKYGTLMINSAPATSSGNTPDNLLLRVFILKNSAKPKIANIAAKARYHSVPESIADIIITTYTEPDNARVTTFLTFSILYYFYFTFSF